MSVPAPADDHIVLPQRPVRAPPSPFPLMAALAPVIVSVLIWLVTRSPFALIFAALGPVIAIASVLDSRWSTGRRLKKDLTAHARKMNHIADLIESRLDTERAERKAAQPSARVLLDATDPAGNARFSRWRASGALRSRVVLGTGTLPSELRLEGAVDSDDTLALRQKARHVTGVPVPVDATRGLGVVGPPTLARACARGILLQLCNAMPPDTAAVRVDGDGWDWASVLPHTQTESAEVTIQVRDLTSSLLDERNASESDRGPHAGDTAILLVVADAIDSVPTSCGVVLEISSIGTALLHRLAPDVPSGSRTGTPRTQSIDVELVTSAECGQYARSLAELAQRRGVMHAPADLPGTVSFREAHESATTKQIRGAGAGTSLLAVIGLGASGPATVDIVRDGPHAIVGGTTGSGKSELLATWVASVALQHSTDEVNFLLVDFKGGSAFAPLQSLPHVVGVLTDLDEVAATRALASLSAEVRYRERMLSELGCRDIAEARGAFPRLVIVVDEFAAMLDGFSELSALFVDIAARGRSLGMHLILCTQRPVGVMKDSLLANCGLRLSLRVHDRSDSVAVVGTDAAAQLQPDQPGRLILASGGVVSRVQVATVTQPEIDQITHSTPVTVPVRRPWLDPLPSRIALEDLEPADGIRLGLADLPGMQRQDTAVWRPEVDGSVLVVGTARSGKTTLLDVVTAEVTTARSGHAPWTFVRVGTDDEETWDVVTGLAARLRTGLDPGQRTLLLIDDLDSIFARMDDEYGTKLRDAVVEILRDGPRLSLWSMLTAQRLTGSLGALSGFAGALLVLRVANRQEHLMTGGESATWVANRGPGNATWRGATVQIALPGNSVDSDGDSLGRVPRRSRHGRNTTAPHYDFHAHAITLVVCPFPQRRTELLLAGNPEAMERGKLRVASLDGAARLSVADLALDLPGPVVLIGDSEDWQAQWALFSALRQSADLVLEGCSVSEYRALTKRRELPPLLAVPGHAWHLPPGGRPMRVRLD
ncbi:FtsK/SpoIIIE domain-containing protein [Mycetocola zhadangensis]|uniref:FtsK domain-containing protein n=1 Tax=Mycetocola zhadangensis TaxID=1164595 RepID=A0A3L7IT15_9MICO|nr:FtsK/SpoIIIE domain-containing protein [Mycetocola zhadangensis]RLQ81396.1 hypothetical protein D9V28_13635 [Mycetocola zhadangensis]GGF02079.1 hypothetical protein GCM10011313_26470 [Mycetocola zhadangensis]